MRIAEWPKFLKKLEFFWSLGIGYYLEFGNWSLEFNNHANEIVYKEVFYYAY